MSQRPLYFAIVPHWGAEFDGKNIFPDGRVIVFGNSVKDVLPIFLHGEGIIIVSRYDINAIPISGERGEPLNYCWTQVAMSIRDENKGVHVPRDGTKTGYHVEPVSQEHPLSDEDMAYLLKHVREEFGVWFKESYRLIDLGDRERSSGATLPELYGVRYPFVEYMGKGPVPELDFSLAKAAFLNAQFKMSGSVHFDGEVVYGMNGVRISASERVKQVNLFFSAVDLHSDKTRVGLGGLCQVRIKNPNVDYISGSGIGPARAFRIPGVTVRMNNFFQIIETGGDYRRLYTPGKGGSYGRGSDDESDDV